MFCSIIIPTIGRDTLSRTVYSVLDQAFTSSDFEVIVINDSGQPLPTADWQKSSQVRILHTPQRERSVARNAGAAVAHGNYLGFMDDDDWFLPEAFKHFHELAQDVPNAAWLYGPIQVVDEASGEILAEVNSNLVGNCFAQIMGGAWAPIQSSLILREAFFKVGGYNPLITTTQDLDLCRRIAYFGDFANTKLPIACLSRGDSWNTSTNYELAPANTLLSRNNLLAEKGAFSQLMSSANAAYWYGRIFRIYLSTIKWNLKNKQVTTGISRSLFAILSLIRSGRNLFTTEFWQGVKAHHVPNSLHYIIKTSNK